MMRVVSVACVLGTASGFFSTLPKVTLPKLELPKTSPKVTAPADFVQPEPKPLTATGNFGSLITGSAQLALRLATGILVEGWSPEFLTEAPEDGAYALKLGPLYLKDDSGVLKGEYARPTKNLVLYEYDASPFSRKVRDACACLDLTVDMKPCPGARAGFSDELFELTGRRTVPYLVDPNSGKGMFESDDIIAYLYDTYGPGSDKVPLTLKEPLAVWSCAFAALARSMPASKRQEDARPDTTEMLPLTLYGYEASPFVKPVREKLCAMALPHSLINTARGSANRAKLVKETGVQFQVPYLKDPNTGIEMFESVEILQYLDAVYTTEEAE